MRLFILSMIVLCVSCEKNFKDASLALKGYAKHCINGVVYIDLAHGAVIQQDINGKLVPCGGPSE